MPGPVGLGRTVETPRDRPPSRVGDGGPGTAHDPWPSGRSAGTYARLPDGTESALLGCVYVDPPEKVGADADVSWWVVDDLVGTPAEAALDEAVPAWLAARWPFGRVRYPGRDLSWAEWEALPEVSPPPG